MANKEAVFSLRVDTGKSVEEIKAFEKGLNDATKATEKSEEAAKDLTARFDEVYGEILPLTGALGEAEDRLYQLALAGDTASQEYQGLLERVSHYRRVQMDTDMVVDQASKTFSEKLVGSVETSAAVFQGFQSVTALVGQENEALVQTMVQLQAVQGVVNSIQTISQKLKEKDVLITGVQTVAQKVYALAVGQSTGAMKLLRLAIVATGIGALVVGIIAAAQALGLFSDGSEEAAEKQKLLDKALEQTNIMIENQKALTESLTRTIDQRVQSEINAAKKAGASQEELNQITKDAAKERLAVLEAEETAASNLYLKMSKKGSTAQFEAAEKAMTEATKKAAAARLEIKTIEANEEYERQKKAAEAGKKAAEDAKKRREEEYKAEQDRLKNLQALYNEYLANIEAAETEYYDSLLTDQQREEQAVSDKFFNLIEQARQHGDDTSILEAAQQKALTDIRKKFDDERLAKIAETEQKNLDLLRSYQELVLDEYQYQLIQFEDQQTEKSKKLSEALAAGLITEQQFMDAQLELEKQYAEKEKELNKAKEEAITDKKVEEINKRTEAMNNYLNASLDSLNSISDLNSLVSDLAIQQAEGDAEKQEKLRKQAFNRDKALQLGVATVQGIQAVQNAFTTGLKSPITAVNPAYPYIQAALAGAVSAANIAKIASSKYGGSAPPAPPAPPAPSGAPTGAGASTFSANTNAQQTETAGLIGGQGQQGGVTQVVVVESDITNVQNKVSAQQALSTY